MSTAEVRQLYPPHDGDVSLKGLYLSHDLRSVASPGRPFVYTSFVVSLDGRIAVPHPERSGQVVPESITNERDWRLFQELTIQSDIVFTSGRYLRDYADGRAQEILRVYDDPQFADLVEWRAQRDLSPKPDLVVISASLDFPVPESLRSGGRRVLIATVENADTARLKALEDEADILFAGLDLVDGSVLVQELYRRGYRMMFNATGPKVLHMLVSAGQLDRIYLTHVSRMLGGGRFSTILEGDLLEKPADFRLNTIYFDPLVFDGLGQLFVSYDRTGPR